MNNKVYVCDEDRALAMLHELIGESKDVDNALSRSVAQYPESADLLTSAAAAFVANDGGPEVVGLDAEMVHAVISRTLTNFKPSPIKTLSETTRLHGVTVESIQNKLGIDRSIFVKLERRLIDLSTIPAEFITQLADSLFETDERVRVYLSLPIATFSGTVAKNRELPKNVEQEPFETALLTALNSGGINKSQFDYWTGQIQGQ